MELHAQSWGVADSVHRHSGNQPAGVAYQAYIIVELTQSAFALAAPSQGQSIYTQRGCLPKAVGAMHHMALLLAPLLCLMAMAMAVHAYAGGQVQEAQQAQHAQGAARIHAEAFHSQRRLMQTRRPPPSSRVSTCDSMLMATCT